MNNNIIPALIIGIAIVGTSVLPKITASHTIDNALDQLERSVETKDKSGSTRIERIIKGISKSVSTGFKSSFEGDRNETDIKKIAIKDKITISQVKVVHGRMKTEEKIIGIIKNESDKDIADVSFNVAFKDKNGILLDVNATFASVRGTLKPGQELGFEVQRQLGDFNEKEEVLNGQRAASAIISITDLRIIESIKTK